MQRLEFRCVQKTQAINSIEGKKVPPSGGTGGERNTSGWSSERSIAQRHRAICFAGIQAGTCRCLDNEAGLIPKFRGRSSLESSHFLNCVCRYLVGKDPALLIRNRLTIDTE